MGELSWVCRSGEEVGVGDLVAVCYEGPSELIVKIRGGSESHVEVTAIDAVRRWGGNTLWMSPDVLLLKVFV